MGDINPNMQPHPETGDLGILKGRRAIFQSFKTLVLSGLNDFIMQDVEGGNLANELFENMNVLKERQIRAKIEEIARIDEQRITIKDVIFKRIDLYTLRIEIKYLYINDLSESTDSIILRRNG